MILNGCLALASGVTESFCHHKPTSSEVPFWIDTLLRKRRGYKHQVQTENGQRMDSYESHDFGKRENDDSAEDIDEIGGQKITWKDLASMINRLALALCVLITLLSLISITVKFLLLL